MNSNEPMVQYGSILKRQDKTPYVREGTCGNNSKQERKPRFSVSQYLNFTIIIYTHINTFMYYLPSLTDKSSTDSVQ